MLLEFAVPVQVHLDLEGTLALCLCSKSLCKLLSAGVRYFCCNVGGG